MKTALIAALRRAAWLPALGAALKRQLIAAGFMALSASAMSQSTGWSAGVYAGQYYDTEPAGFTQGHADFQNHYMVAASLAKTVWQSETWPLSLEIEGMLGQQFGQATLNEVAVAPVLRWSRFPWNHLLQTDFRVGPVGLSYTTDVGPLERGPDGRGSRLLNFLLLEVAFSRPQDKSKEVFVRLHHRCAIYDLLNTYGANGEDFLMFGYRKHF